MLYAFIIGNFLHDLLSSTNSFGGIDYNIPFIYPIEIWWIPVILSITALFLKSGKYKIKKVISLEILIFSFIFGTAGINHLHKEIIKLASIEGLPVLLIVGFIMCCSMYKKTNIRYKKCEKKIYKSREEKMRIIDLYLQRKEVIGIDGKWGIGKTCFLKNFIYHNQNKYYAIYLDISIYNNIMNLIKTIEYELDKIFRENNIESIGFFPLKKILQEYNWLSKTILSMLDSDNIEDNKEKLKSKIKKLKIKHKKKIIIYLDNVERIHKEKSSEIIRFLSLIDEMFKGSGIKIIFSYEKEYLFKVLDIEDFYLNKYIEKEIELKPVSTSEILKEFNNEEFEESFLKVVDDILKTIEYYDNKSKSVAISKDEKERIAEIQKLKDSVYIFLNMLENTRDIEKIYEKWKIFEKVGISSKTIIFHEILCRYFKEIDRDNLGNEYINYSENTIAKFFYMAIYSGIKYPEERAKLDKELQILENENLLNSDFALLEEFKKKCEKINEWNFDDFIESCTILDYISITDQKRIEKIIKIKETINKDIFKMSSRRKFQKFCSLSIAEELLTNIFKNEFKMTNKFFKKGGLYRHTSLEETKCHLSLAFLETNLWVLVVLKRFLGKFDFKFRKKVDVMAILKALNTECCDENYMEIFFETLKNKCSEYFEENLEYRKFEEKAQRTIRASYFIYTMKEISLTKEKKFDKNDFLKEKIIITLTKEDRLLLCSSGSVLEEITTYEEACEFKLLLKEFIKEIVKDSKNIENELAIIVDIELDVDYFIEKLKSK